MRNGKVITQSTYTLYSNSVIHRTSFLHVLRNCPDFSTFEMLWWRPLILVTFVRNLHTSESVRWPAGTYGIPKPASGCPAAYGFQWQEGWRSQDTDGRHSNNAKSAEFHLDGIVDNKKVKRSFCVKTSSTDDDNKPDWPPGIYCIYKKAKCPTGFTSGHVHWDDDDNFNGNDENGVLPDGKYDKNTDIYFCCKTDGRKTEAVLLPTESPFFLLAYKSEKCQMIKWAVVNVEWIKYDTEHSNNKDEGVGSYPYQAGKKHPTIYYCYYRGCNETLTAVNGTLQSPNYPRNYPDGQYCSWRITVLTMKRIYLTFTNFSLQIEKNTDAIYVYNGENATGEVLGVFYGGHPPPREGIYSLTNQMFVIFKSDKNGSYTGFCASYYGVNISAPSFTSTKPPELTVSSPLTHATLHTLKKTTSTREPTSTIDGPSKKGGSKDERKQTQGKGFNVVAVTVPIVLVTFLVAGFIAVFFYCRRKRTKKDAKPNKIIFSAELHLNPDFQRSSDESPILAENPYYDRDFVIANTNDPGFSEGNDLYTEVNEPGKERDGPEVEQKNENPLYGPTAADDAVLNPIYDSDLINANTNKPKFSEGNELYTEVEDTQDENNEKRYMEQKNENPLYGAADVGDAVFNPIYDSST